MYRIGQEENRGENTRLETSNSPVQKKRKEPDIQCIHENGKDGRIEDSVEARFGR